MKTHIKTFILFVIMFTGCKKFVDIDPPQTLVVGKNVFATDATAISVITSIYADLSRGSVSAVTDPPSLSFFGGLLADELKPYDINNTSYGIFFNNSFTPLSSEAASVWRTAYNKIYITNTAINGLSNSTTLTPHVKQQLLGEAYFLRAFYYYHLVILFGGVPLSLTSDYTVNQSLPRTSPPKVYEQIISDLNQANSFLDDNYYNGDLQSKIQQRLRPNKYVAKSLLSKVYLSASDYINAEKVASEVIQMSPLYNLETLDRAFLSDSKEAIWQLQAVFQDMNSFEAWGFILPKNGPDGGHPFYLQQSLLNSFEPGDDRKTKWINSVTVASTGNTFFYPYKYKSAALNSPITEYSVIFRLAEQYLIRAEARIMLNKIPEGIEDLNLIRARARAIPSGTVPNPLPLLNASLTQSQAIDMLLHERQVELFTEGGNRWFDLIRLKKADIVLGSLKPGSWQTTDQLLPIPQIDIDRNPSLTGQQNPGYN